MIIAWWHKEYPKFVNLSQDGVIPFITANWIEKRPAMPEEIEMYEDGTRTYIIKD